MNKTRIVGRIVAGAVASAFLVAGAFSPAEAKGKPDSDGGNGTVVTQRDTGWNSI